MNNLIVLITTSGTGSRLNTFTKYTNKSLIPVGDKYAICHIIDSYKEPVEFIITLGYYGDNVKDFLELAYPKKNFRFVCVDKYEGEGSSLGYSMLKAKEYLQRPFIFHCCDTITNDIKIYQYNINILFINKNDDYNSYSSVNIDNNNKISKINGKGYKNNDFIYTGISYIYNYKEFWNSLDSLYNSNNNNTALSDIDAYDIMIQNNIDFNYSILDEYYDTGNLKSYTITCNKFKNNYSVLAKETENLCFLENRVIKYINDKNINRKRKIRGDNLYPLCPKILDFRNNFIVMDFIKGALLSEYKKYGEIFKLLEWAQLNLWNKIDINDKYIKCCLNFYKNKTLERIAKIPFLDKEISIINGIDTGNIYTLINSIDFSFITTNTFAAFHGDFILDNILKISDNNYCLLDWRHEFDTELYFGDIYYDLAKLRHNIIFNHKNILNDLYEITYSDNEVYVDLKCNYILIKQLEEYNIFTEKYMYNTKKIKILTAIIWLNMAPLYEGKLREFLFYFGKFNLYLALHDMRP